MCFENQVLTSRGAGLFRDAVEESFKIVFTRAIAGSNWDESRGDLSAKPIDWYDGADGSISAVSTANGILQVVASFSGSGTNPVKSVCICVQKKKDGVSPTYDKKDDIIFAACCDDNSGYVSGDSFKIHFNLPVAMSSVVDAVGTVDPDVVHTSGDQTIDGSLTVGNEDSAEGSIVVYNDDHQTEIGYGLYIKDLSNNTSVNLQGTQVSLNGGAYPYATMPLKCEYDTTELWVKLTLGNGHVVKFICAEVEEDPE